MYGETYTIIPLTLPLKHAHASTHPHTHTRTHALPAVCDTNTRTDAHTACSVRMDGRTQKERASALARESPDKGRGREEGRESVYVKKGGGRGGGEREREGERREGTYLDYIYISLSHTQTHFSLVLDIGR